MSYIKRKSKKQEKRTAKEFSGRDVVASGALWGAKGDVRTGEKGLGFNNSDFLIENKFTDKNYYILSQKIWNKIENEALRDNYRTPLMQIDIQDIQVVVIPNYLYEELFFDYDYQVKCIEISGYQKKISLIEFSSCVDTPYFINAKFSSKKSKFKEASLYIMSKDLFLRGLKEVKND